MMEDDTADEQDLLTSALLESGLDEFLSAPSSPAEPVGRDQRQHFLNKNDQYDGQRCHQDGANTSSANQRGPVITFTATAILERFSYSPAVTRISRSSLDDRFESGGPSTSTAASSPAHIPKTVVVVRRGAGATTGSRVMTRGGGTGGNVVSSTRLVQRGGSPTMPRGAVSRFAANNTSLPPLPPNSVYTVYKRGGGLVQQQRKQLPGDAYRGAAVVKRGSVGGRRVRPPRGSTTSRNIPSSSSTGPERTFVHLNSKGEQITYRLVPTDDNDAPAFAQEDADADDDLTFHLSRGAAVSPLVSSIALKPAQAKLAQQQQQQAYQRSQVFVHRGNASTVRMRGGARIRGPSTPHSLTPAHHSYSSSNSYSYRMATGGRLRPALALHKDVPEERRIVKNQDAPVSFQTANVHDYACTATVSTSRQQPAIIRKSSSPAAATGVAASRSRSATPNPALSSSNSTTTTIQPQQSLEVSSANAPAPTAAMTVVPVTSEPIHTLVTQPSSRQAVAQLQPQFYSCATASSSSANQSVAAGGKRPRKEPPEDVHGSPVVVKHGGKEVNLSTTKLMPVSVKPLPVKYEPARIHLPRKKTPSPPIVVTKPRPISPAIQLAPTIVSETIDVETVDVAPIIATTSALSSGMLAATKNEPSVPLSVSTPAAGKTEPQPPVKPKKERKPKEAEKGKPFATLAAPADTSTAADDELDENLGHADTYSEYQPAKLRSGLPHPDCVVETASLSSVAPPDIRHMLTLPEELIDRGAVSALQLEAVLYACQMHENRLPSGERVGYLIGDGAGVGKGRTLACIIFENYLIGRKRSLWFSVSADLKYDSERDLRDVGASKIRVASLSKFKYAKISGKENGAFKKGVLFATYSSLVGECRTAKSKYRSRIKQLIQWCGHDFDGVIVFDECHRAKNLVPIGGTKPTKTGLAVLEIQRALPNARVVYASATGATEPRNMAYMTRLGLWGPGQPFPEFGDFINAVERRGVGAMEIVAIDMKQRGLYLARQLSFRGVTFRVEEVALSPEFIEIYDDSVKLWLEARRQFQAASKSVTDAQQKLSKQMWAQFWACHQRFFKYLCIAAKVDACVRLAREGLKNGKCVVIGLQSTGEARTLEQLEEAGGELTEFVSTAKAVLMSLIEKQFPTAEHSASYGNVFEDFGIGGASKVSGKRKREIMADFDAPMLKRMREDTESVDVESNSSSTSENDDGDRHAASDDAGSTSGGGDSDGDSHSESEESTVEDNSDGGEKEPGEDDWLQTLIAQAESSSSEEEDDDETSDNDDRDSSKEPTATTTTATDAANKSTDDDSQRMAGGGSQRSTDDDFNPFAMDSADDDPWVAKQQLVEDSSPEKARRREEAATGSTTAADKLVRSERKRKKKKKKKRAKGDKEKRQIRSEAQQGTAADFLASSRTIDDVDQLNSGHDPFGTSSTGGSLNLNRALVVKAELMAAAEKLGERLPPNTLDELIDELGGADKVAEMTGRKGRIVSKEGGDVGYELRHEVADVRLEMMNMDEKLKFMDGRKLIAIISEAASSGISLQSDRRAQNQRRRVHITLELPWSADKAIQQFGRTHRSNQVNAPEYIFMISELAGEKRFASVVAKRLESLGALTHGDRRATETRDLSQFNMDNRYGRAALEVVLKSIVGHIKPPFIPPPKEYTSGDFIQDMCHYLEGVGMLSYENGAYTIERETANIPKFLNRLLGLPVHAQNALFQYFADSTAELIARSKRDGTFDLGILDLGIGGDRVRKLETRVFLGRIDRGSYRTEMHKIGVERGVSWEEVLTLYREHNTDDDGFYVSTVGLHGKLAACLIYAVGKKRLDSGGRLFCITRPNTGRSPRLETYGEIKKRFRKVDVQQAEDLWRDQYLRSNEMCQHSYFHGKCRNEQSGVYCEIGRRTRTYFVLSGSVLSVWPVVEEVLQGGGASTKRVSRIQVIRVRTEQDQKIVGLLVLPQFVRTLIQKLEEHCGRSYLDQASEQKQKPSTSRGQ